jgi:glutathione S-transferase
VTQIPYAAIRDWITRIERTPGFVPLPAPDAAAQALIDQSA